MLIRNTNSNLFVPQVSCNAAKNIFCYEGTVLFNHLSNTVKTSKTYKQFKDKFKTCFTHFEQTDPRAANLAVIPCLYLIYFINF